MVDLWGFLLQTLTASGAAVLILTVKGLLRDKLPPRWQFGIWGVLGVCVLIPAGIGGRYTLVNWPFFVDLLRTMTGDYSFTRVSFPFPVVTEFPGTVWQWLFAVYAAGVLVHFAVYGASYVRLRRALRHGRETSQETAARIGGIARQYGLPECRSVTVPGLPSAFLYGVFRPVLVMPEEDVDEKIIIHELVHLKNRDTAWSVLICVLRSLHWCNPLLVYCAKQCGGDLEARCDQMVLELLEGEERRDYGRILLSMCNDKWARTPGATCFNNGGKRIRMRIEAIARFRLYPVGMKLVSVCAGILLLVAMIPGSRAATVYDSGIDARISLSSARTVYCTTPAGAFDCYAKAVMTQNGAYRAMCAPEELQVELANHIQEQNPGGIFPYWDSGIPAYPNSQGGYYIYNLTETEDGYRGLLVMQLNYPPDGQPAEEGKLYITTRELLAYEENRRWVITELGPFSSVTTMASEAINWSCSALPAFRYRGTWEDIEIEVRYQTVYEVDNWGSDSNFIWSSVSFDLTPKPGAEFAHVAQSQLSKTIVHRGSQEERDGITRIGLGLAKVMEGEQPPKAGETWNPVASSSTSSDGTSWSSCSLEPGWGPFIEFLGGGSRFEPEFPEDLKLPVYYSAELYINEKLVTTVELTLEEGGPR